MLSPHDVKRLIEQIHYNLRLTATQQRGTCRIDDCPNNAIAHGLCNAHYIRKRKQKSMRLPVRKQGMAVVQPKQRARIIKQTLVEFLGGKCTRCGLTFPLPVYDFHHNGEKHANVSGLFNTASIERIAQEVADCAVVCANCHRMIEYVDE